MNSYIIFKHHPDVSNQLEAIVAELFGRDDVKNKLQIQKQIQRGLQSAIGLEDYEEAAILRDMLNDFKKRVLD